MKRMRAYKTRSLEEWNSVIFGTMWRVFLICAIAKIVLFCTFEPTEQCTRRDFFMYYVLSCVLWEFLTLSVYKLVLTFGGKYCSDIILAWLSLIMVNVYVYLIIRRYTWLPPVTMVLLIPIAMASMYRKKFFIVLQTGLSVILYMAFAFGWVSQDKYNLPHSRWMSVGIFICIACCMGVLINQMRKATVSLDVQSWQDSLTHLYNHEAFYEELERHMKLHQDKGEAFSILIADIDDFKQVNDTYGHAYGDEVIREVAIIFEKFKGAKDLVARYGGEEFAMIMPNRVLSEAVIQANTLRREFANCSFESKDGPKNFTISIGVAEYTREYDTASAFFEQADKALYEAKAGGKNKVCCTKTD